MNDCEECARLKGELQTAREELATLKAAFDRYHTSEFANGSHIEQEAAKAGIGHDKGANSYEKALYAIRELARLQPYVQHSEDCLWCGLDKPAEA